jgi:DNA mismatch repair protein MutL
MSSPSRIQILPPELADQIAAGEVVERPASVVKELVENSLDARARRVEIEMAGGGLTHIVVRDDGHGMSRNEAHLALRRHATSKLRTVDELFALSSLGFRGEALPSIAAVSRLKMTTRMPDAPPDQGAYLVQVEAGRVIETREVGAPVGTTIEVKDLFFAVPARKKFAKSEGTEASHVTEAVLRLALAHPQVHFRLRTFSSTSSSEARTLLDLPPHPSGLERARAALLGGRAGNLYFARLEEGPISVEAYLGSPADSESSARAAYQFVNGRPVRDRGLLQAILLGYGELLDRGRYPLAVVKVCVPGVDVDINVHPQKSEVRFARPAEVYAAVRHALSATLAKVPWLSRPRISGSTTTPLQSYSAPPPRALGAREPQTEYREGQLELREKVDLRPSQIVAQPFAFDLARTEEVASLHGSPQSPSEGDGFFSSLTYLGQLHRTYLLCQAADELVLIDQHAAHERVHFERVQKSGQQREARAQRLLLPVQIAVDRAKMAAAVEHAELLGRVGLELEPFGEERLLLRALPELVSKVDPAPLISALLERLGEGDIEIPLESRWHRLYATMACHAAVRAGDPITEPEVRALFTSLDGLDYRAYCPHGRPVLVRLSLNEIERRFGRI